MNPSSSSSQSFDPSQFNHQQQQQQLSYYNNVYSPQQQWRPPIYPPGVQLPNQQTDVLNPVVAVVAAALVQNLSNLATVYPQPVIAGPPGFGSASFPGHVSGPSALVSHGSQVRNPLPTTTGAFAFYVKLVARGLPSAGYLSCVVCEVLHMSWVYPLRTRKAGQSLDEGGVKNRGGQNTGGGRDNFSNFPPRPGGSGQSLQGKGHNLGRSIAEKASARVTWCEVCKVRFGKNNLLELMSGKKHRSNLIGQYEQKHSGDLKQDTAMKPDNLLAEEEIKKNLPEVIPSDTLPTQIKLVHEQKINDVQQADSLKDADPDILAEKPMLNQPENQRRGKKRLRKKNTVEKEKRQLIEPPKPKVVPSLMCDLCNFGCERREYLMGHLLSKKHKSKLKRFEGPQAMYGRIGLQALYPPTPVTQTVYHFQGVQQIFYGAQVSIPTAGTSILPRTDKAAPSATSWVSNFQRNPNPQVP